MRRRQTGAGGWGILTTITDRIRPVIICEHDGLLIEHGSGRDGNPGRCIMLRLNANAAEEGLVIKIPL